MARFSLCQPLLGFVISGHPHRRKSELDQLTAFRDGAQRAELVQRASPTSPDAVVVESDSPVEAERELERPREPQYVRDFTEIPRTETGDRDVESIDDLEPERGAYVACHGRLLECNVPVLAEGCAHASVILSPPR